MCSSDYFSRWLVEGPEGSWPKGPSRHFGQSGVALFEAIRPLLNGKNSAAEIYAKMAISGHELREVSQVLDSLASLKMLGDVTASDAGALTQEEFRRYESQIRLFDNWLGEDPAVFGPQ